MKNMAAFVLEIPVSVIYMCATHGPKKVCINYGSTSYLLSLPKNCKRHSFLLSYLTSAPFGTMNIENQQVCIQDRSTLEM